MASAKFANSTVNQSQIASCSVKLISPCPVAMSRASTSVVRMLPTSTTNMTGFRTILRGASLVNDSRAARRTMGASKSGRLVTDMLEEPPGLHQEVLHDRTK